MSKIQMVPLKVSEKEPNPERPSRSNLDERWSEGLRNHEKLKRIFPWLEEDEASYL
jgi:hypothetical protein